MDEGVAWAVDVEALRKTYFGAQPLEVLHGITLRVRQGEFVAVVGQSGSGKSTLLNLLGALDRPTGGIIRIGGQRLDELTEDQLAGVRNTRIGFIFQFHYLLDEFSCLDNAMMPIRIQKGQPSADDVARVTDLLARVGLGERLRNRPSELSGGEQQRTAIIRALANQPRLVLADEPTGNLDSRNGREVFALMRDINRAVGTAVIMVTHDERLAAAADRILGITDGWLDEQPR